MTDNSLTVLISICVAFGILLITSFLCMLLYTLITVRELKTAVTEKFYSVMAQLQQISAEQGLQSFMNDSDGVGVAPRTGPQLFKTIDGRYSASSLPELLKQIIDDPNSGLDETRINYLKKFFEKLVNESDFPPDEDFDDPRGDNWNKKK